MRFEAPDCSSDLDQLITGFHRHDRTFDWNEYVILYRPQVQSAGTLRLLDSQIIILALVPGNRHLIKVGALQ